MVAFSASAARSLAVAACASAGALVAFARKLANCFSASAIRSASFGGFTDICVRSWPDSTSKKRTSPSQLPVTKTLESARATILETTSVCLIPRACVKRLPSMVQRAVVPSLPQLNRRPSGVKATDCTEPPCAAQLATRFPVLSSQVVIVPSVEQLASTLESERQARSVTLALCWPRLKNSPPFSDSQTITLPLRSEVARRMPSGLKSAPVTHSVCLEIV